MVTLRTLSCSIYFALCICCTVATSQDAVNHNSSRSNRGTVASGGDSMTDLKLAIGNDMIVRKKPGR